MAGRLERRKLNSFSKYLKVFAVTVWPGLVKETSDEAGGLTFTPGLNHKKFYLQNIKVVKSKT